MHMTWEQKLEVVACEGVYTLTDTARYYGVHHSTIQRIWASADVMAEAHDGPFPDPPNIWKTKPTADLIIADTQVLLDRGWTIGQVARLFGVSTQTIRNAHAEHGLALAIRNHHTVPSTDGRDRRAAERRPRHSQVTAAA